MNKIYACLIQIDFEIITVFFFFFFLHFQNNNRALVFFASVVPKSGPKLRGGAIGKTNKISKSVTPTSFQINLTAPNSKTGMYAKGRTN